MAAGAVPYAQSNWAALCRYPEHGDLSIDNNLAERMLRAQAIGRRNWTFLGSDRGGRTAAILYSMTGTCKHHDIDPFAYLTDILRRLPSHPTHQLNELLPDVWFTSHPPARRKKAAWIDCWGGDNSGRQRRAAHKRVVFGAVGRIIAEGAWPAHSARIECATAHAILRAEGPMNTPKQDKTIDQLFEEFLADQEARLSPKTFDKYEGIILLYRSYLESYWPDHTGKDYDAITKAKGTYCGAFGAKEITSGFSEFLGYFMPRKVIAGNETMKAAGTVVKKLTRWLVEKGHTRDDESIRELVGTTARDLPASLKLLDRIDDWLAENAPEDYGREVEGHFSIQRVEPGQLWLESILSGEREIGPIPLPEKITRACKVGWDVGGVDGETAQGWRLVEVWNIPP